MFCSIEPISKDYGVINIDDLPKNLDRHHEISLSAPSKELLLIDFLSEALYLSDVNDEAYFNATFSEFSETSLKAMLHGIEIERFQVVEIKAVTYHELKIEKINNSWQAEVVFDI